MVNLDPAADHFEYPVSVGKNSASVCVCVYLFLSVIKHLATQVMMCRL